MLCTVTGFGEKYVVVKANGEVEDGSWIDRAGSRVGRIRCLSLLLEF